MEGKGYRVEMLPVKLNIDAMDLFRDTPLVMINKVVF